MYQGKLSSCYLDLVVNFSGLSFSSAILLYFHSALFTLLHLFWLAFNLHLHWCHMDDAWCKMFFRRDFGTSSHIKSCFHTLDFALDELKRSLFFVFGAAVSQCYLFSFLLFSFCLMQQCLAMSLFLLSFFVFETAMSGHEASSFLLFDHFNVLRQQCLCMRPLSFLLFFFITLLCLRQQCLGFVLSCGP